MASAKDTAAKTIVLDPNDYSKWSPIQIGFAPYWHPTEGAACVGSVIEKDDRNPNFVRYLLKAYAKLECKRGPRETGQSVVVEAGETFSMGVFSSMIDEFDFHLYMQKVAKQDIPVRIEAVNKTPTSTPVDENDPEGEKRQVWNWKMFTPPEKKKILDSKRDDYRRLKMKVEDEAGA